jgi:integrase
VRFLRESPTLPSPRDRAIALIPFYAGARIAEIVGLDVDDVRLSVRKGVLRIVGKGEQVREIPIHPQLRATLTGWLDERPDWPGAETVSQQARRPVLGQWRARSTPRSPQPLAWGRHCLRPRPAPHHSSDSSRTI